MRGTKVHNMTRAKFLQLILSNMAPLHFAFGCNAGSAALRVLRQGGQLRDTWHWRRRAASH